MNNNKTIAAYYILDLDRTLLDTAKSTELMRGVVALHDTDLAAALEQQFAEYTSQGESFSMRDFISDSVGEEETAKIEAKYKAQAASWDLLNPGAKELMEYIMSKDNTQFGILTYGSPLGQTMKIEAAGLGATAFLVTSETYKGAQIAGWRGDDDAYHLPEELGGYITKNIIFIDDKPFSFKGLPIDCLGYLVRSVYDAGIEKLPPYVIPVDSLQEVIAAEKQRTP